MLSEQGYLLIADISGYTAFLTQGELEHAQEILESLLHVLLEQLKPPLVLAKLEGDALFCYAPHGSFLQGQTFLESIENVYYAFRESRDAMQRHTTCTCQACKLIPTLDLKFVLHHGIFLRRTIGGREELSGPDVILLHRLLKNEVVEATGIRAYALLTAACTTALHLGEMIESMVPHREEYEHLGEVQGYVHDLDAVWKMLHEQHRAYVQPEETNLLVEFDLPLPPVLAWDYLTEPERKREWRRADILFARGQRGGRMGVGASYHCAHGTRMVPELILDWRPFEYITYEHQLPWFNAIQRETIRLLPTDQGTHVEIRFAPPEAPTPLNRWLIRLIWQGKFKRIIRQVQEEGALIIREQIKRDQVGVADKADSSPPPPAPR